MMRGAIANSVSLISLCELERFRRYHTDPETLLPIQRDVSECLSVVIGQIIAIQAARLAG